MKLDLDAIEARHWHDESMRMCSLCMFEWPCDAVRMVAEVRRLRAENAALEAALEDIAGMLPATTPSGFTVWLADAECSRLDDNLCHVADPTDTGGWCGVCVAEVTWCAWKLGVLG